MFIDSKFTKYFFRNLFPKIVSRAESQILEVKSTQWMKRNSWLSELFWAKKSDENRFSTVWKIKKTVDFKNLSQAQAAGLREDHWVLICNILSFLRFHPNCVFQNDLNMRCWNEIEDNNEKIYCRFSHKFTFEIDFSAYGLHRDPTPVYELKNYGIGFGWLTKELVQLSNGRAVGILSGSLSTINSKETLDYVTKCCFHHLRALRHDEKTPMLKRVPQMKPQIKNIIQDIVKHQGTENFQQFF